MTHPTDLSLLTQEEMQALLSNPIILMEMAKAVAALASSSEEWTKERVKALRERAKEIASHNPEKYSTELLRELGLARKAKVNSHRQMLAYYVLLDKWGNNPADWDAIAGFSNREKAVGLTTEKIRKPDGSYPSRSRIVSRQCFIKLDGKLYRVNAKPTQLIVDPILTRREDGVVEIKYREKDQLSDELDLRGGDSKRPSGPDASAEAAG